jgi:hypothetical protein
MLHAMHRGHGRNGRPKLATPGSLAMLSDRLYQPPLFKSPPRTTHARPTSLSKKNTQEAKSAPAGSGT